MMQVFMHYLHV